MGYMGRPCDDVWISLLAVMLVCVNGGDSDGLGQSLYFII